MTNRTYSIAKTTASSAIMLVVGTGTGLAQKTEIVQPAPISRSYYEQLKTSNPALFKTLTHRHTRVVAPLVKRPDGSPWQPLTNQPNFSAMNPLLLTDGTVLVADSNGSADGTAGTSWFRLTPDINGSYVNGTWSQLAPMQSGYLPLYFATAILPDGRVIAEGGEYNNGTAVWSGQGSIYDPVADAWTPVAPPAGMTQTQSIGDASGIVLDSGTFMLSPVYVPQSGPQQLFNAATLAWTATGQTNQITNDEASQALLQGGRVLTTASYSNSNGTQVERYVTKTGVWVKAAAPPVQLWDEHSEIGPQLNLLDGTAFAVGSTLGHTAIFNPHGATWKAGPDLPVVAGQQYGVADGPGVVLPSGHVLLMAGPGYAVTPAHFFVYDGTAFSQVADTPNAPNESNFQGNMLVLPNGQVLLTDQSGDVEIYTDPGTPVTGVAPTLINVPTTLKGGSTYTLSGSQLNGVTQGASYGDDYQSATNYPIVQITNSATQHVFYARTAKFSSMSIHPGLKSTAQFTPPVGIETGASQLVVIASGFASTPTSVQITP